jgi:hypothetical protein
VHKNNCKKNNNFRKFSSLNEGCKRRIIVKKYIWAVEIGSLIVLHKTILLERMVDITQKSFEELQYFLNRKHFA